MAKIGDGCKPVRNVFFNNSLIIFHSSATDITAPQSKGRETSILGAVNAEYTIVTQEPKGMERLILTVSYFHVHFHIDLCDRTGKRN